MSVEIASSIQEMHPYDSIVARRQDAVDFFDSIGQLRTHALHKNAALGFRQWAISGVRKRVGSRRIAWDVGVGSLFRLTPRRKA